MSNKRIDERAVFWVRCIGYNQDHERFFSVGKEYEVCDGVITADNGFAYSKDFNMRPDTDPGSWYLSTWYKFEIVEENSYVDLGITFDDIINGI